MEHRTLMDIKRKESAKLRFLYVMRYFGDGAIYGFLPCFFLLAFSGEDQALQLGILLSSIPFTSILGNAVVGKLSGDEKRNLTLIRILMPIEVLFVCSIGFVKDYFVLVFFFSVIGNFINNAVYALMDSVTGEVQRVEGGRFIAIRSCGAFGYLFGALCVGFLAEALNPDSVLGYGYAFLCMIPVYGLAYGAIWWVSPKDLMRENGGKAEDEPRAGKSQGSYKALFRSRSFVCFLAFTSLLIGMVFFSDNVYTDYWNLASNGTNAINNKPSFLGMSTALTEVVEFSCGVILSFFITPKTIKWALFAGGAAFVIRCLGLGVLTYVDIKTAWGFGLPTMALLMGVNMVRGISFSCYNAASLPMVEALVGDTCRSKGMFSLSMGFSLVNGVGQLCFKYIVSGFKSLTGSTGHYPVFFVCAGLMVLALFLLPMIRLPKGGKKEKARAEAAA